MSLLTNRREFLKRSFSAGLGAVALPEIDLAKSQNGRIRHGAIGVGGMGWADVQQIGTHPDVEIAAICDVDTARMAAAAKKFPNARRYQDWRELLEKEGDKIDSVSVSTPDHMHAPITMTAINRGKHVYCQKPLTHDVHEARRIAAAAAKADVVTQMGIRVENACASSEGSYDTPYILRAWNTSEGYSVRFCGLLQGQESRNWSLTGTRLPPLELHVKTVLALYHLVCDVS